MLLLTALTQTHSKKKDMSKWSRETQENVPIGKAKSTYTLKAAKKGKCAGSSYN